MRIIVRIKAILIFHPTTSQCLIFKPIRYSLYWLTVHLKRDIINYVDKIKYIGHMFTNDKQGDVEILRQLRAAHNHINLCIVQNFYKYWG